MIESEIIQLYKYTIRYRPVERDEYTVILVSDNILDLISLIAESEMVDPMREAAKWFEITDFLWVARKDKKWYHLFDINEQDLAVVKYGYDVQEQYRTVLFKGDCPEFVKDVDEIMWKMKELGEAYWDILGQALYESHHVQNAIREKRKEKDLREAEELDAGISVIEEIVKGEC